GCGERSAARRPPLACRMTLLLAVCFTLSGAAALALEMLWLRSAGLVIGQTAATAATVLVCYFAVLAIGALAVRGVGGRPLRVYACLEIGVALGTGWSLAILHLAGDSTAQRWVSAADPLGAPILVALAIVPATMCLGATLPMLGRAVELGGQ